MKCLSTMCLAITLFGCSETSPNDSTEQEYDFSPASILMFKDGSEMLAHTKEQNDARFRSMDDLYREAMAKLDQAVTAEDEASVLREYGDVVEISREAYSPIIDNLAYRRIINRDRMYVSGSLVHKVVDKDHIVFTEKEHVGELRAVESIANLDPEKFRIASYRSADPAPGKAKATACGNDLRKDYFDNHSNCRNDRRAWVRAYAAFIVSGFSYTPAVISEAWAERRTGTACNWKQYANILHTRNCSFQVEAILNNQSYYFTKSHDDLPDYDGESEESEHLIWGTTTGTAAVGAPIIWGGGVPPEIGFSAIHLESSSQGVGADNDDHWAVIDCQ